MRKMRFFLRNIKILGRRNFLSEQSLQEADGFMTSKFGPLRQFMQIHCLARGRFSKEQGKCFKHNLLGKRMKKIPDLQRCKGYVVREEHIFEHHLENKGIVNCFSL